MVENLDNIRSRYLPNQERISILSGMITLAYIMAHFVSVPVKEYSIQLPGFFFLVRVDINTLIGFLVAGLTATGADWIYRDHPKFKSSTLPYLILPALTALVIGFPIKQLPFGANWWVGLLMGVLILGLVLIGEYISLDPDDSRHPLATAGLSAISVSLFLVLATSLRSGGMRLFLVLPGLALGALLVSLRLLHLRLNGQWLIYEASLIAFVVSQFTAAFYYWPITPVAFGVLLIGFTYTLISAIIGFIEEKPPNQLLIEPVIAVLISIGVAIWAS